MEQNKTNLIIILAVGIIALAAGFFIGQIVGKSTGEKALNQNMREVFSNSFGMTGNNLSGKITKISSDKNSLTVEILSPLPGMNLPEAYKTKIVSINPETKIIIRAQRDQEEFNKEMMEFSEKMRSNPADPIGEGIFPPRPFIEEGGTVDDLKEGDQINFNFTMEEGLSILDSRFAALQISVTR